MVGGVPDIVQQEVIRLLAETRGAPVTLLNFSFLGGGCINHDGRLETSQGNFFMKWNDARQYPRMFETEAHGLHVLRQTGTLHVARVIGWFEQDLYQGIVLELVESNGRSKSYGQDLGRGLAALHQHTHRTFGLDIDNYIGSLPQGNTPATSWVDFFIHQRLAPQLRMAVDSNQLDPGEVSQFETLYKKLPAIFPEEKPALLHGDLWSGNVIVNDTGAPCLIDPAVYYGHREAELAFTQLFGGFDDTFLEAYHEVFALAPGFAARVDTYNLYPLLVHVNLFGGSYAAQVKSILRKIV
jgi:protein-ribulosamine 3-kinase